MEKHTLLNTLEGITLSNPQEQTLIDSAINELHVKKNKAIVLSSLKREFGKLAMQQKLSAKGVKFLSKINRPDINEVLHNC
ncbi:hypothetical protein [Liquorilactobacillus mali]|uniref:Uncharacterized protein n=1 Tax=Liquorilactobacillus mali KCTC 3596 = DSM 20444 TaxID=1046596 RepID=J1F3V9_9LACO|nr:hypothetical protein [Liquorilactobacillus mali]EJF00326.1 hypothetical protein LMA_03738 [Liquorilactobacillus mali KCTC 3596 = DSM 20444]KRN04941.1 hypothetical protein FD00_GL000377 [Liquorilactobacillus mali KCTC 3596 = DSM 20444]MDC7954189.1 hypothetical protein [Liquorilactobacillus mali]QFQ75713.1 hypothetical protein LM596_11750 [Liquorilactobacillus mali]